MMGLKNNVKKLLIFILLIYILGLTCGLVYLIFLRKLQLGFYSIIRLITCSVIPIGCFFIVQKIDDGFSKLNMKEKVLIIVFICIIFIGNQLTQKKEQINGANIPSTKINSVSQQTISATE